MIEYIKGKIVELNPTELILDNNGIGYKILISLQTYEKLKEAKECLIYIHHHLREDDEQYFGFAEKQEREVYRLLISVSGVGASTARVMLSSLSYEELKNAILSEDITKIKSIKGIGLKTAQRIILELKDKIVKGEGSADTLIYKIDNQDIINEASSALLMLGYSRPNINKAIQKILKNNENPKVEEIIKLALQLL